jgi:hypothetical protein
MHVRLFSVQFLLLLVIAVLHASALAYDLYWRYVWLDVPMHLLGGMWAVLSVAWFGQVFGWFNTIPLTVAVCALLVIALGWEVFEYVVGVPREANFVFDTVVDLVMDAVGGVIGFSLARRLG